MTSTAFVPRYVAIEHELRARIARMQPGDALPSDSELCEEFGVSRMTARNAVHQLKLEGLVERVPGRGTFVAERSAHRQAGNLLSFSEEMRRRGVDAHSEVVEHVVRPPSAEEARRLELEPASAVLALSRVRIGDRRPVALEDAVLPAAVARALEAVDLEVASLHESLVAAGHVPTAGRGTLQAEPATPRDAKLLGLRRGAPLLVERRLIHDQDGRPLELSETRYVAERYSLDFEFGVELATQPLDGADR